MFSRRQLTCALITACTLTTLVACKSGGKPGPTRYVTVIASPSAASSSSPPPSSSASASTAAPPHLTHLAGTCDNVLAEDTVDNTIGKSFKGQTAFVVGLPDKSSGRVTYINCRYGVSGQARQLEIQVSLYRTAAEAAARIQPTVNDFEGHNASASKTTVDGIPATLLQGGSGEGYGPTIVLAYGQRTVAVTLAPGAVPASGVTTDLTKLAALAVKRTSPV